MNVVGLHSAGYLRLLGFAGLIGVPLSFVAFAFLATVHKLEHLVWHSLPNALGFAELPPWWPILTLGFAGLLVGLAVQYLPGRGGHAPTDGLDATPTPPHALLGVLVAAVASLTLGAVVGPEAPLVAIGSGLALLAVKSSSLGGDPTATAILPAAGSAAAISAVFGNPLVAVIIFIEVMGLARRQTLLVVLPCLLSSGIGALVFTGLGNWTGLPTGTLALPGLAPTTLGLVDVLSAVPIAAAIAVAMSGAFWVGRRVASLARTHVLATTRSPGLGQPAH